MDTIFAPLTIKGKCSIYVLRISGNRVSECLERLGVERKLKHREATLCALFDGDSVIDEALLVYFEAPHSFTGEDVVELNLHCSNYIISKVISILLSLKGVRPAERGEFSKRAFLNGKMDLMQAESINDLVNSETELQHRLAINQLQGKSSNLYNSIRQQIVEVLSIVEAFIDFPEEEISSDLMQEIQDKIQNTIQKIKDNLNDNRVAEKIKDGFRVAIIGEPNSGKSTLLNYLSKRDIAIVSNIAGTTRDIIEVNLDIAGIPVILYDTAGIRETNDIIEKEGVKRAIEKAKIADIRMLVVSVDNQNINDELLDLVDENTIILINKIDIDDRINNSIFNGRETIKISLKDNINLSNFLDVLQNRLESIVSPNIDSTITNERYRRELLDALEYLEKFDFINPIEINAENIRLAAEHIGRITGAINSEEILDNIFSKFCIGK